MTSIDKDLARLSAGHAAGAALELIAQELDNRERTIATAIFRILSDQEKTLDPQKAVQGWIELHEINKLRQSLSKRQRVGVRASERVAPDMNAA